MSSQGTLWLFPLMLGTSVTLLVYIRMGIRWTWGFCLQSLVILAIAASGFLWAPPGICAGLGWGIFVLAFIVPRGILGRMERNLMFLNSNAALAEVSQLRWFFWGAPGRFWTDMAKAMSLYIKGEGAEAEAVIKSWYSFPLPDPTRRGLESYLMTGRVLLRDWDGIVSEFERMLLELREKSGGEAISHSVAMAATRAYLEKGEVKKAVACLKLADLPSARLGEDTLNTVFLPFFALSGEESELREVLEEMAESKDGFPDYARLLYEGRCKIAQGKISEGRQILRRALEKSPAEVAEWQERIKLHLDEIAGLDDMTDVPDWSKEVGEAKKILAHSRAVREITSPSKQCWAVNTLLVLILVAYGISHSGLIIDTPLSRILSLGSFGYGVLEPSRVLAGEYWRNLTYLFLHAHISHLALNIIGLWWFGRMAETLFGTTRFLVIYFLTGYLSGMAHVLVNPSLIAVGASGAVMGVFGASIAGIYRLKGWLPESIRTTEMSWLLGLAFAQIVLDQFIPNVAVVAHLGGLFAGLAIGLMLPVKKDDLDYQPVISKK